MNEYFNVINSAIFSDVDVCVCVCVCVCVRVCVCSSFQKVVSMLRDMSKDSYKNPCMDLFAFYQVLIKIVSD
jgi:hypothetical protein